MMPSEKTRRYYAESVANAEPTGFWKQVGRTVNGVPVDESQIAQIVDAVASGLALAKTDVLLDLGCGNGALSRRLFEYCHSGLGIDFVDSMIHVAHEHFTVPNSYDFLISDIEAFVDTCADPERFTKGLCSFAFQYLAVPVAERVLSTMRERFTSMRALFLGDMPDKSRMHDFYYPGAYVPGAEDDHESPIGMWRTPAELAALAAGAGWHAEVRMMPATYHAAHYRFNAVLTKRHES